MLKYFCVSSDKAANSANLVSCLQKNYGVIPNKYSAKLNISSC